MTRLLIRYICCFFFLCLVTSKESNGHLGRSLAHGYGSNDWPQNWRLRRSQQNVTKKSGGLHLEPESQTFFNGCFNWMFPLLGKWLFQSAFPSIHLKLVGFRVPGRFFPISPSSAHQIPGALVTPFGGIFADVVGRGGVAGPYKMGWTSPVRRGVTHPRRL